MKPILELLRAFFVFWQPIRESERWFRIKVADLENIAPGQLIVLTDTKTRRQWAVIDYDDFSHVIDTGNRFRLRDITTETVNGDGDA